MAAPSKSFTTIGDSRIDANSPVTAELMEDYRDNDVHLEEWMGGSFTAAVDHDHDGVNSSLIGGASGGAAIVLLSGDHDSDVDSNTRYRRFNFQPEMVWSWPLLTALDIFVRADGQTGTNSTPLDGGAIDAAEIEDILHGVVTFDATAGAKAELLCLKSLANIIKISFYTGNGASPQTITGVGFKPEMALVWHDATAAPQEIKTKSSADANGKRIFASATGGVHTTTGIRTFATDGFDAGSNINTNLVKYWYLALRTGVANGEGVHVVSHAGTGADNEDITFNFTPHVVIAVRTDAVTRRLAIKTKTMGVNTLALDGQAFLGGTAMKEIIENGVRLGTSTTVNGSGENYDFIALRGGVH